MPGQRNTVWSYDFVYDACANGQTIKCLTVVDEYTRECLAIDVAGSIRSKRVIDVLSKLISVRGSPRYLRSDNALSASDFFGSRQSHSIDTSRGQIVVQPSADLRSSLFH